MRNRSRMTTKTIFALVAALAVAGCGPSDGAETGASAGHDMGAMTMDPTLMVRHAEEMDSVVRTMRQHVDDMRQLLPSGWHERMTSHAPAVAHMVGVLERQTREMDMGMNLGDEVMGAMMGMSGEEHRTMMDELQALRNEVGELQTAPDGDVVRRMPAHLDRIERMLLLMERSAAHMRTP